MGLDLGLNQNLMYSALIYGSGACLEAESNDPYRHDPRRKRFSGSRGPASTPASPNHTTKPKISSASSLLTMPSKGLMKPIPSVQLLLKAQPAALTPGPTGVGSEGP